MSIEQSECCKVTVLLSTYNGIKYLHQQLESLYTQSYPNIALLARDDGSTDTTREILEKEKTNGRLQMLDGRENLGVGMSFFELLKAAAATDTEYVAFCDQDDYWNPDKIARALSHLAGETEDLPVMYCSRLELVDEDLGHVGYTDLPKQVGFGNALVENIAVGCTMVLNRAAFNLIVKNLPDKVVVHDWWCYLVISCFGKVIFDTKATLKYRQHSNNAVGATADGIERLSKQYQRFFGGGEGHRWMGDQANSMKKLFGGTMPESNRKILNDFIAAKNMIKVRVKLIFSRDIWRQKRMDNFLLRVLFLINRF